MAQSYADRIRAEQQAAAKAALTSKGNPLEFTPDFGTHRVRLLPPRDFTSSDPASVSFKDKFYASHSYHFMHESMQEMAVNGRKGSYFYTRKKYEVDGKMYEDPIDQLTRLWYDIARKANDDTLAKLAGTIKRKRRYSIPVLLLDEPDPKKRFRILVDPSNDGKLIKLLCTIQGLPFYRDIDDEWVDKETTEIHERKKYFDLLDIDAGYDISIVKAKKGNNAWDITFEQTFVEEAAGPRPLDATERALLGERVDLKTYIPYVEDYNTVVQKLIGLVGIETFAVEPGFEPIKLPPQFDEVIRTANAKAAAATVAPAVQTGGQQAAPKPQIARPPVPQASVPAQVSTDEESAEGIKAILDELEGE